MQNDDEQTAMVNAWCDQEELAHNYAEGTKWWTAQTNEFWESLDYEQKLLAFSAVCNKIYQGDIIDEGSYRHVLYQVFGFDIDSYSVGMDCHYMDIHNSIDVSWKTKKREIDES